MGLESKRTLLYFCPPCREGLFQVPKLIKSYDSLGKDLQVEKTDNDRETRHPMPHYSGGQTLPWRSDRDPQNPITHPQPT